MGKAGKTGTGKNFRGKLFGFCKPFRFGYSCRSPFILSPLIAFIILVFIPCRSFAQIPGATQFVEGDEPFQLSADRVTYDAQAEVYTAEGDVRLSRGTTWIKAQSIVVDIKEKTVQAQGDCVLGNAQGELRAPSISLDAKTETGVIVSGNLVIHTDRNNFYMRGDRIEKVGPNRYVIENGWYSTCDCGEDEADWYIEAQEIDITLNGFAVVRHARIFTWGLPVAYVPYGVVPAVVSRRTGFLNPRFGWATDDGYHAGIPFFWAIDDHVDATIYTDAYENRGVKNGLEYRYALTPSTRGQFDLDYIDDDRYGERRWALSFEHMQRAWRRLYVRTKINAVSDNDYVNDFPEDITARYDRFLRSDAIVNNLWQDYDLNIDFRHYDDLDRTDNSHTFQKLPEARFDAMPQRIGGLPLAWDLGASVVNFYRQRTTPREQTLDGNLGYDEPYLFNEIGRRMELAPALSVPMDFDRWAFLTPSAQVRETAYDLPERAEGERSPSRFSYVLKTDLYTRTERVFPLVEPVVRALKHTVEPGAGYLYEGRETQDDLPIFDEEDRRPQRNEITYYLANRLWARILPIRSEKPMTWKLVDLKIFQTADLEEAQRTLAPGEERRPLGPIVGRWESAVNFGEFLDKFVVRSDLGYDTYMDRVRTFNIMGGLGTVNDDSLTAEYRYQLNEQRRVEIEYLSGQARYTAADFITFSYLGRYSFLDEYFIERLYGVEFHSLQNCWDILMQLEQREIPQKEMIYRLTFNFTGLVTATTSF